MNECKTLQDWKDAIAAEVDFIDLKPYSHNIVSICLQAIARYYGEDEANRTLEEFGLDKKGWQSTRSEEKRLEDRGF